MRQLLCLVPCLLVLVIAAGCGGPGENRVHGSIQFDDGTPLDKGELIFDSGTYSDIASVDDQGQFEVEQGLPPGTYKITLGGVMLPDAKGNYAPIVHPRYLEYQSTDLSVTVPMGDNPLQLVIDGPKK